MKIETKIAKNGVKLYYVDGKRTSGEVALQAAADNRENLFTIEYATRHNAYFTNGENQVYESTSKAVLKELELKIDEYHGFTVKLHTIGWVEICKLFNKDYAKSLINKIENAFIRGEYGVKIDTYGKVSILPTPVIEPNPDDYAVTEDALEVAVNAEIQNANDAKINDIKWEIRYVEGSINDLDQNHIAHAPNDQSLKERRAELVNELDNLNAQLAELLPNEILQTGKMVSSEPATEPEVNPIITGIKEEQPMTIEIPAEGTHEFTIGDDTVCFFNGKFHSVFSAKYHMAIVRDLVGCFSYCIYNDGDTEVFNVGEHAVSYDNFMETLHQRGNREKLLALRKRDAQPSNDNTDDGSNDEEPALIVETKRTKRDSINLKLNGSRISLRNLEERLSNAANENFSVINQYGKKYSCYPANNYGYFGESPEGYTIHFNTLGELIEHYAVDNIIHTAEPADQPTNDTPADNRHDTEEPADNPTNDTQDTDRDEVFNLLPDLDNLNDFSETDPYLMDDDAEYTERDARFNYGERYAAALTEKLSQYDPTVEVTYDIDDDDHDTYYLKFDGIYGTHYALAGIERAFHSLKKDIAEEEFMKRVDGTLDDKIAALKRKQARDSINRAIKQCIRNRIGYLKSHNSKMEKYEYELLCLLQGARRELEVA